MKEAFEILLMKFCFLGLGGIAVLAFFKATWPSVSKRIGEPVKDAVRYRRVSIVIPIACVCGLIGFASNKSNVQTNDPAAVMRSIAAESTPHLIEPWFLRGGRDTGHILTFDEDWCFPDGTNHLQRVEVWGSGAVYPSEQDSTPIAELATKLLLKPNVTRVTCGRTTNNTYRIEWHDAYVNRMSNETIDASIELFRNGDVIVTENGVTTEIPYDIPFEHDGFGQDEDWVRANYTRLQQVSPSLTNAEEIISIGYASWVDQQVGVGLTNGLYKFTAEFLDDPPEPTQLYIGDWSVCVTNAGEYVFVLGKGTEYEFGTWPFNDDVDYWAQDDLSADAPMLTAWWGGGVSPGEWTIDGGGWWFWRPSAYQGWYFKGCCAWWPTFQGTPNLISDERLSFPRAFSVSFDHPDADQLTYHWASSDRRIQFSNRNSKSTMVMCEQEPRWGELNLSVSTQVGNVDFFSSLVTLYGTNSTDRLGVSCCCPEYFDMHRSGESLTPITLLFNSPEPTNGVVRAFGWTNGGLSLYFDRDGTDSVPDLFEQTLVDATSWRCTLYAKGESPSETVGDGEIMCYFADGREFSMDDLVRVSFTVVDRKAEPILSRPKADSDPVRYYNPCCAEPNSEIHLCATVEPSAIPDSQVSWQCVSGGATFVSPPTGRDVVVRMGAGTAVFEIETVGLLPGSRPMRLTVYALER